MVPLDDVADLAEKDVLENVLLRHSRGSWYPKSWSTEFIQKLDPCFAWFIGGCPAVFANRSLPLTVSLRCGHLLKPERFALHIWSGAVLAALTALTGASVALARSSWLMLSAAPASLPGGPGRTHLLAKIRHRALATLNSSSRLMSDALRRSSIWELGPAFRFHLRCCHLFLRHQGGLNRLEEVNAGFGARHVRSEERDRVTRKLFT